MPADSNDQGYLNTGQSLCHDADGQVMDCAGSGQDAEFSPGAAWPEPRFTVQDDVVRDNLTGLEWTRNALLPGFPLAWSEALDFVEELNGKNYGGHTDWRLPDRREMRSLISYGARVPALPPDHRFTEMRSAWFWTATTYAGDPDYAWYVHTEGGRMFYGRKDGYSLVLPVRGQSPLLPATGQTTSYDKSGPDDAMRDDTGNNTPWPLPRFVASDDSVLDKLTGLTWTRNANLTNGTVSWKEAFALADRLNNEHHADCTGWRLPTINELESLVDASQTVPALPADHPFTNPGEVYWSSTNSAFEPDWAMCLYLHKGAVGVGFKRGEPLGVWCVARKKN